MGEWADFFVAELGAAAALAGLVIVAISINVTRILSTPLLPGRAAETLVTPTGVLLASTYALVPHQPGWLLGGEVAMTGVVMWIVPALIQFRALRTGQANWARASSCRESCSPNFRACPSSRRASCFIRVCPVRFTGSCRVSWCR
jgi:hypothetical protein